MSKKTIIVGIRHDKLNIVDTIGLNELDLDASNYAQPISEVNGIISTGVIHNDEPYNLLINSSGTRHINSAKNEVVKETGRVIEGLSGLDIAGSEILKSDNVDFNVTKNKAISSFNISLFSIDIDKIKSMPESIFMEMVDFIRERPETIDDKILMTGNYIRTRGEDVSNDISGLNYIGTINRSNMAILNIKNDIVTVVALPNIEIDLKNNQIELDLASKLGFEEKRQRQAYVQKYKP